MARCSAGLALLASALAACGGGGGSGGAANAAHRVASQPVGAPAPATPAQAAGSTQACPTGELFTANAGTHAVVVHDRMAFGDRPPVRTLSGASTGFVTAADASAPRGVVVDVAHDELIVSAGTTIRAFARSAAGNAAPARTIAGPTAGLVLAGKLALDALHDEVWVADASRLRAFARSASGDEAPVRTITAGSAFSDVAVDPTHDEVLAIYSGNVVVYARTASGAAPFLRTVGGAGTTLRDPRAVAVDAGHGEVFVLDWASSAATCSVTVFDRTANGQVAPLRRIVGPSTLLQNPTAVAYDADRDELLVTNGAGASSVIAFGRTDVGDVAPRRVLTPTGALYQAAGLSAPQALAIAPATATCAAGYLCATGGCIPPATKDCGEGHYCPATAGCEQLTPGMVCGSTVNPPIAPRLCAFGTTCPAGWVCASGGCMPAGGADCATGLYCASGLTCSVFTHQCSATGSADCGNGTSCASGTSCTAGGLYCEPPGAVDCGSGWYCDAGLVCTSSGGGYVCDAPGSGGGAYCYSTSACVLGAYGSCNCSGAASQAQCLSGHPACSGVGSACGDGTHACCANETCINGRCEAGCGRCAGNGCTP